MTKKRVLLLGSYGQTNLGDDLLLHNYLKYLRSQGFTEIFINTSSVNNLPAGTLDGADTTAFETYKTPPLDIIKLIRSADCIVYGGGTVFKELYSSTGRSRFSTIARIAVFNMVARFYKKPVHFLHIGIGSIKTLRGRLITKIALSCATKVTFRDKESYSYAKKVLGIASSKLKLSTDGLFINPDWQKPWKELKIPAHSGLTIGVNILADIPDWVNRIQYITHTVTFLNKLMAEGNFLVIMPFQTGFSKSNDYDFFKKEIMPKLTTTQFYVAANLDLTTIISCLKQIDLLVGMRFHSLLLATMAQTPFIGLAYDTKCWRFLQDSSYPHAIKLEDATCSKLYKLFKEAIADTEAPKKVQEIKQQNLKTGDLWLQNNAL